MNYYIQGDAAKAQQIKAAFKAKGIYSCWSFENENYLYYSCGEKVNFCFIGGGLANIIKTHPDYKELKLSVEPKFKVGDRVIYKEHVRTISGIDGDYYELDGWAASCPIEKQDELLRAAPKKHYDIANFKPFDKVLVRDGDKEHWSADFFMEYDDNFYCFRGSWEQCIPFNDDTKHLLGTTDMPSEEYINW